MSVNVGIVGTGIYLPDHYETAKEINNIYNLEKAANIASFKKIYEAMKAQGV